MKTLFAVLLLCLAARSAMAALSADLDMDDEEIARDKRESQSYCDISWPSTPLSGAAKWQKPLRPLVLFAGVAGSMLHTPVQSFPNTWKKLWVAYLDQDKIALKYLAGVFNGTMVVERNPYDIQARHDGFGLCSIDNLDPDLIIEREDAIYYHNMILYLITLGYTPGVDLFGFPYDWRQSVRHAPALEAVRSLILNLHEHTGQPVDVMTHSMGGLFMKSYVSRFLEDTESVLGTWTAIASPFRGGGSVAFKAAISGYSLDMTTVPIFHWGLSEPVAHTIEINWPSTFELMPDLGRDEWWNKTGLTTSPYVSYHVLGQEPAVASTNAELKSFFIDVNARNMQAFPPSETPIPNPLNVLAWDWAQTTKAEFAALPDRLKLFRETKPSSTFKVFSLAGSALPTKYTIQFPRAVRDLPALREVEPAFSMAPGDGTVPYASASSDGLGATQMEYRGSLNHKNMLSAPEIFQGSRVSLGLSCLIEGSWVVHIYDPNGHIFSTQTWTFNNESAKVLPGKVLSATSDEFNTTLPDGTPIFARLDPNCLGFVGTWYVTYRAMGVRVVGTSCLTSQDTRKTPVPNGELVQRCIYGFWSNNTNLVCNPGFQPTQSGTCIPIPLPSTAPARRGLHTVWMAVGIGAGVLFFLTIGIVVVVWRMNRKKGDTEYRQLPLEDPSPINSPSMMIKHSKLSGTDWDI